MLIEDVRLNTADVDAAARFYSDVLELPVVVDDDGGTVTVGRSTITLVEGSVQGQGNHLAFTIPSNQFAAAEQWLSARTELMAWGDGETELRLGEPWNSESVYFLGPDGIILELITRQHLDNPAEAPFTGSQLLCVSEVGLATVDVPRAFADARRAFGIETFAGESPHFTTAGDQEGLLILVTTGRPWFPTDDILAVTSTIHVRLSGVSSGVIASEGGWTVTGRGAR